MRNRLLAVLAVVVACFVALPSPAFASTYIGDQTDKREAAANYLGYGWQEQSEELKNELGTTDDSWCYDRWQAWLNSISRDWSNSYWVTSYEGFMLVDAKDKAKADFEKAIKYVETGGFEGSGGGDIPDSGSTGGGSSGSASPSLVVNSYFVYDDKNAMKGKLTIPSSLVTRMQLWADEYQVRYFVFAHDRDRISGNYVDGYGHVMFFIMGFTEPPTYTYNVNSKRYVCDISSAKNVRFFSSRSQKDITGNYLDCAIVPNMYGGTNTKPPNCASLRYVTDIIEFKLSQAPSPSVVPSGSTINVYEGDTSNITANIDNSSTSVENSTTIYDTETNTYTTVNNITTNNNVDVSAITQRLDSINAKVGQIGTDLNSQFGELNDDLKALFLGLGTTIDNGVTTLRNQLVQAVSWLQIIESDLRGIDKSIKNVGGTSVSVSGSGTDLTRVEGYLSEISDKLDSSVSTSGETDLSSVTTLVDDVEGQLDTIANRIGNLVNGVPSVPRIEPTNTVVTDDEHTIGQQVGQKAEELSRRFPFSLPWDVQFILSLLVREPVAPEFDLPVIGSDDAVCHVDLSDWEPVAVVCRQATKILFALGLALRTRQLVSSWGSSGD